MENLTQRAVVISTSGMLRYLSPTDLRVCRRKRRTGVRAPIRNAKRMSSNIPDGLNDSVHWLKSRFGLSGRSGNDPSITFTAGADLFYWGRQNRIGTWCEYPAASLTAAANRHRKSVEKMIATTTRRGGLASPATDNKRTGWRNRR